MTGAGGHAPDPRPASYREPAAVRDQRDEQRTTITYEEPWGMLHVFLWCWCWFWDVGTLFMLAKAPGNPMLLLCHLPIGTLMTSLVLGWTWSALTLEIGPCEIECRQWFSHATYAQRTDIEDVLVTQRLFHSDGEWVEWIVSVRYGTKASDTLFSRTSTSDQPLPKAIEQMAILLAHALARPVTRETLDERKR